MKRYLGSGGPRETQQFIAPLTEHSLQNYFEIPKRP